MRRLIVGAVIDASGSMDSQREAVIEGYNDYLVTLSTEPAEIRMSRTVFESRVHLQHDALPMALVPRLGPESYVPNGDTALRDGIGLTITRLEETDNGEDAVLVFIMTDGGENASRYWAQDDLQAKIREKEATGRWRFVVFGASNLDPRGLAGTLGIDPNNIRSFEMTPDGIRGLFQDLIQEAQKLLTDGRSQPWVV